MSTIGRTYSLDVRVVQLDTVTSNYSRDSTIHIFGYLRLAERWQIYPYLDHFLHIVTGAGKVVNNEIGAPQDVKQCLLIVAEKVISVAEMANQLHQLEDEEQLCGL